MMTEATIKESKLHDLTHFGIRAAIGAIFIFHGSGKFDPGFQDFLTHFALPTELHILIALAETIGGIMLIAGVLTRIAGAIMSIILLGAIFYIKGLDKFSGGSFTGWEFDVVMLAGALATIVSGPGRVSISHIVKKIPRFLQ